MIKDVAYNPGAPISGTTQVNSIAIAGDNPNYLEGSWVGGVDNSNGYVIISDTTTAGLVGRTTGGGTGIASSYTPTFWKSNGLTDQALIDLFNKLPGSEGNFNNINDVRNALEASAYVLLNDYTTSGTSGTNGSGGGGGGVGAWYFYSTSGTLDVGPPVNNGNAIFLDNGIGTPIETYDPNSANGVNEIFFNVKDSSGTDYTSQFNSVMTSGGTITITQNGNSAKYGYTANTQPSMSLENFGVFAFRISATLSTQIQSSNAAFNFSDPISLTFN